MKQFLNVLKFELGNYFKSKSFMVTTILLALAVAAAVALPPVFMKGSFSEVFGGSKGSTEATGEEAVIKRISDIDFIRRHNFLHHE